jgi:hypothetical protein
MSYRVSTVFLSRRGALLWRGTSEPRLRGERERTVFIAGALGDGGLDD